jgi:hypothetical protein
MKYFDKHFFATRQDQLSNLQRFEAEVELQYILEGMFELREPTVYSAAADLPELGVVPYGDYIHTPSYLVKKPGKSIGVREEPQQAGGVLYLIDLPRNPTAFAFRPSGRFRRKAIIAGSVGTAMGNKTGLAMCRRFWSALSKGYVKVGRYYVGPEAYRFLEKGGRLTLAVTCPKNMDLRL